MMSITDDDLVSASNYFSNLSSTTAWQAGTPLYYGNTGCPTFQSLKFSEPLKEGIEMKNLYEVFLVYGEDRKNPIIVGKMGGYVIANDDEDARVKSGVYSEVDKEWDADYLTIIVRNLGAVKVKEKAKEVKNV
jgi:hypothetical protein